MSDPTTPQGPGTPDSMAKKFVRGLVDNRMTAAATAAGSAVGAAAGVAAGAVAGAASVAAGAAVGSAAVAGDSLKSAAGKGADIASEGYRRTGAKAVVDRAGEKLDEITGKAILEEVKLLVQRQAVYNDVLATKLQEALDRIAELEAKVDRP